MNYRVAPGADELPLSKSAANTLQYVAAEHAEIIPGKAFAGREDDRNELIDKGAIAKSPSR